MVRGQDETIPSHSTPFKAQSDTSPSDTVRFAIERRVISALTRSEGYTSLVPNNLIVTSEAVK